MLQIKIVLITITGVIFLSMSGLIWYLKRENTTLTYNNTTLNISVGLAKSAVIEQKNTILELKHQRTLDQINLKKLQDTTNKIIVTHNKRITYLNAQRERLSSIAMKKPKTVQRLATTKNKKFALEMYKLTLPENADDSIN